MKFLQKMDEYSSGKVSQFNNAIAQLMRLDYLWQECHRQAKRGNYFAWNANLDKIYSELIRDYKKDEKEYFNAEEKFVSFLKRMASIGSILKKNNRAFKAFELDYPKLSQYYSILLEKEIWLGQLQNALGKGTQWKDEFEDDIE